MQVAFNTSIQTQRCPGLFLKLTLLSGKRIKCFGTGSGLPEPSRLMSRPAMFGRTVLSPNATNRYSQIPGVLQYPHRVYFGDSDNNPD